MRTTTIHGKSESNSTFPDETNASLQSARPLALGYRVRMSALGRSRADSHTCEPTLLVAHPDLPLGIYEEEAVVAIDDVRGSIEDTCLECESDV
jgi:hypothetical protein